MKVALYETILRDGMQAEGMHLSVSDKIEITRLLDDLGVAYIEGGWPGSNPRDVAYFERVKSLHLGVSRIAAFGATRRAGSRCDDDPSIQSMLRSDTPVITVFGKAWRFQAESALQISPEENLALIEDSIRYLVSRVDEVIFDAEHFFDGYREASDYAMAALEAAVAGGAHHLVLCDTNGGTLTNDLQAIVKAVAAKVDTPLGIHTHNDSDLAVANSIVAVAAGATMVQGTINGYGERCGNANLVSVIPALELKMERPCLPQGKLSMLAQVAHTVDEIVNRPPFAAQPYVGQSAFAHKGGVHANAVMKDSRTYEHIEPELVGNRNRILVSDLSGKSSVCMKAKELGFNLDQDEPAIGKVLERLKYLENRGYQFEGADASFKLMIDEATGTRPKYFKLHDLDVRIDISNGRDDRDRALDCKAAARIKVEVGGVVAEARDTGEGPVHAIDKTLRKLIDKFYPSLKDVRLIDYKVRVLTIGQGTSSVVRVLIRSGDGNETWDTVGVSENIIEASWHGMVDALEYQLIRDHVEPYA
jgi:2-isopropylmalate synthase